MDAEYADKLTLSRAAKAEIILAGKYLPAVNFLLMVCLFRGVGEDVSVFCDLLSGGSLSR